MVGHKGLKRFDRDHPGSFYTFPEVELFALIGVMFHGWLPLRPPDRNTLVVFDITP